MGGQAGSVATPGHVSATNVVTPYSTSSLPHSGFGLALVAGFFFGFQFLPIQFMRLCDDSSHSCDSKDYCSCMLRQFSSPSLSAPVLDYVYSHYTSIFLTGTVYFALYCAFKRNKPQIYPKLVLPALASGVMWGVAMCQ